jgi:hypothetical protein
MYKRGTYGSVFGNGGGGGAGHWRNGNARIASRFKAIIIGSIISFILLVMI